MMNENPAQEAGDEGELLPPLPLDPRELTLQEVRLLEDAISRERSHQRWMAAKPGLNRKMAAQLEEAAERRLQIAFRLKRVRAFLQQQGAE